VEYSAIAEDSNILRSTAALQRTAILYTAEYCGISEESNILRSIAPLQRTAIYCGVQRHCRGQPNCGVERHCRVQQQIAEYSAVAEDSNILTSTAEDSNILRSIAELQRTATYSEKDSGIEKDSALAESSHFFRGQDILKRALRRTVHLRRPGNCRRQQCFRRQLEGSRFYG
jgi:hypothetical protein